MHNPIAKRLLMTPLIIMGLFNSFYAHGETVEVAIAKVTIVVDGMMKSKSGAT